MTIVRSPIARPNVARLFTARVPSRSRVRERRGGVCRRREFFTRVALSLLSRAASRVESSRVVVVVDALESRRATGGERLKRNESTTYDTCTTDRRSSVHRREQRLSKRVVFRARARNVESRDAARQISLARSRFSPRSRDERRQIIARDVFRAPGRIGAGKRAR